MFVERYDCSIRRTMSGVFNAIRYVVQNGRRHRIPMRSDRPDPYTSGPWFRAWYGRDGEPFDPSPPPVVRVLPHHRCIHRAFRKSLLLTELPICARTSTLPALT